jgi:hypothetical protein
LSLQNLHMFDPRSKKLYLSLHGGLGDQLFMYFSCLKIAEVTNRELILSKWTIDPTHAGSPFGLIDIVPNTLLVESKPRYLDSVRLRVFRRLLGSLRSRVSPNFFYPAKRFFAMKLGLVFNVLSDNYDIGDFEYVLSEVEKLRHRKNVRLDCYFDTFEGYQRLENAQETLPGLFRERESKVVGEYAIVHFRVGDIFDTYTSRGVLGNSYYSKCVEEIRRVYPDLRIIGVSDRMERAQALHSNLNIEWLAESDQLGGLDVLCLFIQSKVLVAANSGLSIWGAMIGRDLLKVYIPIQYDKSNPSKTFEEFRLSSNWVLIENDFISK